MSIKRKYISIDAQSKESLQEVRLTNQANVMHAQEIRLTNPETQQMDDIRDIFFSKADGRQIAETIKESVKEELQGEYITSQDADSRFVSKEDVEDFALRSELEGLASEDQIQATVQAAMEEVENTYLKKEDAETTYAKKEDVQEAIDDVKSLDEQTYLKKEDAGQLATKEELQSAEQSIESSVQQTYLSIEDASTTYLSQTAAASLASKSEVDGLNDAIFLLYDKDRRSVKREDFSGIEKINLTSNYTLADVAEKLNQIIDALNGIHQNIPHPEQSEDVELYTITWDPDIPGQDSDSEEVLNGSGTRGITPRDSNVIEVPKGAKLIDYIPTDPEAAGFFFGRWYSSESPGNVVDPSDETITVDSDCEFKALWIQAMGNIDVEYTPPEELKDYKPPELNNLITITFDGNGVDWSDWCYVLEGSSFDDSHGVYPGGLDALPAPKRPGYKFIGWSTSPENQDETFTSSTPIHPNDGQGYNCTVYAKWKANWEGYPEYTVTLDANGWYIDPIYSQPTTQMSVHLHEKYGTLPDVNWRDGYIFVGWFTDPEEGVEITSDSTKTIAADETLYAHWIETPTASSPNLVNVTFLGNGGTPTEQHEEFLPDGSMAIVSEATREHFQFDGWWTEREGGRRFGNDDGDERILDQELQESPILYVHWIQVEDEELLPVTFNPNGGDLEQTEYKVYQNECIDPLPVPTWDDNHLFLGWRSSQITGYGSTLKASTPITPFVAGITWYAQWNQVRCKVTFDDCSGTYCMPIEVDYGTKIYDALPIVYRWGFEFLGWYLNGKSVSRTTTITQDSTIVARWRQQSEGEWKHPPFDDCEWIVTLNTNGGTQNGGNIGGQSYVKVNYNQPYGELPTPTWEGHTFVGWFISKTSETKIESTTIVRIPDHHTLFGRWVDGEPEPEPVPSMLDDSEIQEAFADIDQRYPIPENLPEPPDLPDEDEEKNILHTGYLAEEEEGDQQQIGTPICPFALIDPEYYTERS